jgi:drug/metabolite transporter (DMT)-like permease
MAVERRSTYAGELALLLLLATLWGASYSFIKVGVETIPPLTLIAARTAIAAVLLLALLRWRGIALPRARGLWGRFFVQALLNSVVPFTLIAWAEQSVDAGIATILNSCSPIFTFLLTWAMARSQPISGRKLFGVASGLVGICLIVGVQALSGMGRQLVAELALIAATICYAGAVIFGRRSFEALDAMVPAAGSLVCGAILLAPLSLLVDRPWTLAPSTASIFALVALSVFSTALALTIYFRLIHTLGPVGATAQAYVRAPIGVAIGVAFLGETPAPTTLIGLACVIAGVAAMTAPARKAAAGA